MASRSPPGSGEHRGDRRGQRVRHARHRRRRERRRPFGTSSGAGHRSHRRGNPPPRPGRRGHRAGPAARGRGEVGAARRVPAGRGDGRGRRVARRLGSPMVGRERELARLRQTFEAAIADRSCQLFTIRHPGRRQVPAGRRVPRFTGGCHGPSRPVPPVRGGRRSSRGQVVKKAAGLEDFDPPEEIERRSSRCWARTARRARRWPSCSPRPSTTARSRNRSGRNPVVPRGRRADGTARGGVRRHPLG